MTPFAELRGRTDRAPDPEPAAAPAQPEPPRRPGSLDTISADLARMIDGDEALDLWERHRRGDPGVFTPAIYDRSGSRDTFEGLQRSYAADAGFRRTVDRYVSEFEKLLEGLPDFANAEDLRRAYLTSDTGRVFLVLAHASGRLG